MSLLGLLWSSIGLMLLHTVGDVLLQRTRIYRRKVHNPWAQALHVLVYIIPFFAAAVVTGFVYLSTLQHVYLKFVFLLTTAVLHYATDSLTDRALARTYLTGEADISALIIERPRAFFTILALDQTAHIVALLAVFYLCFAHETFA